MGYYLTRIDQNCDVAFSDFLLTGARWLTGGESYSIVPIKSSDEEISHVIRTSHSARLLKTAKIIVGLVLVLLILPTVIGFAIKSFDVKAKERYFRLDSYLSYKPVLAGEYLSKAPAPIPISDSSLSEMAENKRELLAGFLTIQKTVCRHNMAEAIKNCFNKIWEGNFNLTTDSRKAMIFAKNSLAWILINLPERTDTEKEEILQLVVEVTRNCHPTWIQRLSQIVRKILLGSGAAVETELFLSFVQKFKEEVVLREVQRENENQWHGINYVKRKVGAEFGLDTSVERHDGYSGANLGPSVTELRTKMYKELSPFQYIRGVTNGIQEQMRRMEQTRVSGIDGLTRAAADLYARKVYQKSLDEVLDDKNLDYANNEDDPNDFSEPYSTFPSNPFL